MTLEYWMLAGAVALLQALILVQVSYMWLTGRYLDTLRGREPKPKSPFGKRIDRTVRNHVEGMVIFAPLVGLAHVAGVASPVGMSMTEALVMYPAATGTAIYVAARIPHAASYIAGLPPLRAVFWFASLYGVVIVGGSLLEMDLRGRYTLNLLVTAP